MTRSFTARHINLPLTLDIIERIGVGTLYGILALSLLNGLWETGNLSNVILLASEGSIVVFVLIRRLSVQVSLKPLDWITATLGTTLPLMVQPTHFSPQMPAISSLATALMLTGFAVQIAAKFTLKRSFGIVAANRGIKVSGPYQIVRHPMYSGYVLTHIGFLISHPSFWNIGIYTVSFGFQLARILAEERILSQDAAYREFSTKTQYRLVPRVF